MADTKQKVPNLRFKGFTNDWEQHKLGEVCEKTYSGLTGKNKQDFGHGKAKYVTYLNVHDNAIATTKGVDQVEIDPKQNEVVKGDLLFTVSSEVPEEVALNSVWPGTDNNVYLNSFCFGMRPMSKSVNSFFLTYYLRSPQMRRNIYPLAQGISRFNISKRGILSLTINLPNIREQINVYKVIKNIECLITLQQRKLELLKQLKKGFLQKMFPKNGAKVPELRFAGFADAWEQRKLGELGKIYTGNTPKTSDLDNWTDNKEGHIWITPTDIDKLIMSDSERHLSEQGWSKARKIPENSVLITSIASIGKNTINAVPVAFNQQINAIVPEKNDSYFILSAMIKDTARFASLAGQTATAIINKTTFEKFQIATPSYEEQQKIGLFFKQLDDTITLHQRKLDLLKEQKKGFLQKMFV